MNLKNHSSAGASSLLQNFLMCSSSRAYAMLLMVEAFSCSMIVLSRKRLRNLSWSYTCATEPKRFADKKEGYLLLPNSFAAVKLS